jgi:hypothetical protein
MRGRIFELENRFPLFLKMLYPGFLIQKWYIAAKACGLSLS